MKKSLLFCSFVLAFVFGVNNADAAIINIKPQISSISPSKIEVDDTITIYGTKFDKNASVYIDKKHAREAVIKGSTKITFDLSTLDSINKSGTHKVYVVGTYGTSNTVSFTIKSKPVVVTPTNPITTPVIKPVTNVTATLAETPTLVLGLDVKKNESTLKGTAFVNIQAASEDVQLYAIGATLRDSLGNGAETNGTTNSFSLVSGATAETISFLGGNSTVYRIKAGQIGKFKINYSNNPQMMFAGSYKLGVGQIALVNGQSTTEPWVYAIPPTGTSNAVTIVGEKSPYISTVTSPIYASTTEVVVTGSRFSKTANGNIIYISAIRDRVGVSAGSVASKDGKTLILPRAWFKGIIGRDNGSRYDILQIEDPLTGKSNSVTVELQDALPTNPLTISWTGGKTKVQLGLIDNRYEGSYTILGWIQLNGGTNGSYTWDKKNVTDLSGNTVWPVSSLSNGPFRIIAITESPIGNYCSGGGSGECSYSISDSFNLYDNVGKIQLPSFSNTQNVDLTSTCPTTVFTRDLTIGSSGNDVAALQNFLRLKGYMAASTTGYFGPTTKAAVSAYEVSNGLSPSDGTFGASARAKMALDCSPSTTISPVNILSPNGGEIFKIGEYNKIKIDQIKNFDAKSIQIEALYIFENQPTEFGVYSGGVHSDGVYGWFPQTWIWKDLPPNTGLKIKVIVNGQGTDAGKTITDTSDGNFFMNNAVTPTNPPSVNNVSGKIDNMVISTQGYTVVGYYTLKFSVYNPGSNTLYISKNPSIALATSTVGINNSASSTIITEFTNPSSLAADSATSFGILAGASRDFTFTGVIDNTNDSQTHYKKFIVTAINYGTSSSVPSGSSITSGIDNLYAGGILKGQPVSTNPPITISKIGDITTRLSPASPEKRIIATSKTLVTSDVNLGIFSVKEQNQAGMIKSLNIKLSSSPSAASSVFQNVRLIDGATTYVATSLTTNSVTFTNLSIPLAQDAWKDLKVVADVKANVNGVSVSAALIGSSIVGVDSNSKTLTLTNVTSVESNGISLFVTGTAPQVQSTVTNTTIVPTKSITAPNTVVAPSVPTTPSTPFVVTKPVAVPDPKKPQTPLPTANLTANGASGEVIVHVGEKVTYAWNSTNADIFSSDYTSNCGNLASWIAKTKSGAFTSLARTASEAGCTYNFNFYAKNKSTGATAKSTLVMKIVKKEATLVPKSTNTAEAGGIFSDILKTLGW